MHRRSAVGCGGTRRAVVPGVVYRFLARAGEAARLKNVQQMV